MFSNRDFGSVCRVVFVVLVVAIAGGCGGETNPAMALQFADRVFVLVDPVALSGDGGTAKMANLHAYFVHIETAFGASGQGPVIVVYSNVRYLPAGTAYVPVRVKTLFKAALADSVALGIVVNPGVGGVQSYLINQSEIEAAIPRVMQHKPLPFEVLTK